MGNNEEKFNDGKYSDFIEAINIEEIFLKSIEMDRNKKIKIEKGNFQFELKDVYHNYYDSQNEIYYEIKVKIMDYPEDEKDNNFYINLSYGIIYNITDEVDISEEILDRYEKNAVFNVWPYIRNSVSDISNKMELNLPPVPLFKF